MEKTCNNCEQYKPNMDKMLSAFVFLTISSGSYLFNWDAFSHCPYCGAKLIKKNVSRQGND